MKKGNIYKTKEGVVVMYLADQDSEYFEGVVLYHPNFRDVIGVTSKHFKIKDFTEYIGALTINNVLNER